MAYCRPLHRSDKSRPVRLINPGSKPSITKWNVNRGRPTMVDLVENLVDVKASKLQSKLLMASILEERVDQSFVFLTQQISHWNMKIFYPRESTEKSFGFP